MGSPEDMLDIKAISGQLDRHYTTITRWLHDGVLNRKTGVRIYLQHEMLGGQIKVKREWVSEFIAALQPPSRGGSGDPLTCGP